MNVLEKTDKVLTQPVCDHCLGRQFAQLLSGYGNAQRGRITTSALTTSSATVYNFDFVNNKLIGKDHPVLLTVSGGGNTGGRPFVFVNKLDAVGSAQISVGNAGVAVLNGTVVISFLVI